MVNRVLIRVKVVQLLYSYLLTRSDFKIEEVPESTSRDKRYSYSAYIDFLLLLLSLSGYNVANSGKKLSFVGDSRLAANKVAKVLSTNDTIRSIILREVSHPEKFEGILDALNRKIIQSSIFNDYTKKSRHEISEDVTFWITVFETIIARDKTTEDAFRNDENFTLLGYQNAITSVCDTLRSYNDSRQMLYQAKNDLETSLTKAYELYLGLLKLIVEITEYLERRQDRAKNKFIATSDDLNPNTRLVDNALVAYLRNSPQFQSLLKETKAELVSPVSNLDKILLDKILESELYRDYIEKPVTDFVSDVEFWREAMRTIILPSDSLMEELEDTSVFWNDDINVIGTFVLKTLRKISRSEGKYIDFLPKFKDDDDAKFGSELFMFAVRGYDTYKRYVDMFVDNSHWDPERMAYMDVVIMVTAIAEIINYPTIPIPVSINEYVEIANNYSTDKSGAFINGILFSVVNYLREQNIIFKQ